MMWKESCFFTFAYMGGLGIFDASAVALQQYSCSVVVNDSLVGLIVSQVHALQNPCSATS